MKQGPCGQAGTRQGAVYRGKRAFLARFPVPDTCREDRFQTSTRDSLPLPNEVNVTGVTHLRDLSHVQ